MNEMQQENIDKFKKSNAGEIAKRLFRNLPHFERGIPFIALETDSCTVYLPCSHIKDNNYLPYLELLREALEHNGEITPQELRVANSTVE